MIETAIGLLEAIAKSDDENFLCELIQDAAQRLIDIEVVAACCAGQGERSPDQANQRKSSRPRQTGRGLNNRVGNSHLTFRRRERRTLRFGRTQSLQKFSSARASVGNHFNQERGLSSRAIFKANRAAALAEWRGLCTG